MHYGVVSFSCLELELISHCFFYCSFVCDIWNLIEQKLGVHFSYFSAWYDYEWINEGAWMKGSPSLFFGVIIITALW